MQHSETAKLTRSVLKLFQCIQAFPNGVFYAYTKNYILPLTMIKKSY